MIISTLIQQKIHYGVYLIILSLPLYLLRFKIWGVPTTVLEIMIYTLFILWIMGFIIFDFGSVGKIRKIVIRNSDFLIPLGLIFIGVTLSMLFSPNLRVSAGAWKGWLIDPLLLFIVLVNVIKTEEHIRNILRAWAISGFLVAATGLVYFFSGNLTYDGRLQAVFNSPNYLAMYLAPSLLITYYLLLITKKSLFQIFWLVNLIVTGWALYLTHSYGAWLGILAAILWIFFARPKENIRYLNSLLLKFYILLFIIFIVFLPFYSEFSSFEIRSSFQSRLMIWRVSWEIIKDHPILGIGPGVFQEYYLKYQPIFKPYLEWAVPHPHNLFLNFWSSGGIIGLFGFAWLLIWFFKKQPYNNLSVALTAIIVYIIIHGLFDSTYWKNDLAVIFWAVIGLVVVINKNRISIEKIKNPQIGF